MTGRAGTAAAAMVGILAVLAPVASAAAGGSAQAGSASVERAPAGSEPLTRDDPARPGGATAMIASAVYPGLGQLLNGTEPKAAIVSAVEVFLVAGLVVEDRRARNSLRLYKQTNDEQYYDDYSEHFDKRQTLIWWAAVAALYGLADAYVDAHLAGFEESSAPRVESSFGGDGYGGGEFRVGVTLRF